MTCPYKPEHQVSVDRIQVFQLFLANNYIFALSVRTKCEAQIRIVKNYIEDYFLRRGE